MPDRFSVNDLIEYASHEILMNIAANIDGNNPYYYETSVTYQGRKVRVTPGETLTSALTILQNM